MVKIKYIIIICLVSLKTSLFHNLKYKNEVINLKATSIDNVSFYTKIVPV